MKAATPQYWHGAGLTAISIHAAREGGDIVIAVARNAGIISIHAAREGGDVSASSTLRRPRTFQSTPPVKAATMSLACTVRARLFQSTPPVKAATQMRELTVPLLYISIHAAREGGDDKGRDE